MQRLLIKILLKFMIDLKIYKYLLRINRCYTKMVNNKMEVINIKNMIKIL